MIPRQRECNYILVGICGYCGGRVAAASTVDGPALLHSAAGFAVTQTPQCRDCGAFPERMKMLPRRFADQAADPRYTIGIDPATPTRRKP